MKVMSPWAPCGFGSGATTTQRHASRRRYRPTRASASYTRCRLRRSPWPAASKRRTRSPGGFLELEPTFRAIRFLEFAGFVKPEIREAFAVAFREAGLPE